MYIKNPKLKGSNIMGCAPQEGECPFGCKDCFAYRPGAYLGEHGESCPNIPSLEETEEKIVRVNDINDSHVQQDLVIAKTSHFDHKFYNTSIPKNLNLYPGPVVLTANPGEMTDTDFWLVEPIPENLMFVRARVNTWNLSNVRDIVKYYTDRSIEVVFTYMAYYETPIPEEHKQYYEFRQRTLNSYWCITEEGWDLILEPYEDNLYVYTCGGDYDSHACKDCGNCEHLYHRSLDRCELD